VDNPTVAAALAYIAAHAHRRIGPTDVAAAVGAEPRTLQNYFRKAIQRPIATEIRRVRIERAKRELAQTDRALADVARAVGFGTVQRLHEVFVREVGVAPGAYRAQRQLRRAQSGRRSD
jgi:LacI family transcriptional regulator